MKVINALICQDCSRVTDYDSDESLSTAMPLESENRDLVAGNEDPSKSELPGPSDGDEKVAGKV